MRKYIDIDVSIFNPFTNASPRYYKKIVDRKGYLNKDANWYFNFYIQTNLLFEFQLEIGHHFEPWTSILRVSLFGFTADFKTGKFVTWAQAQNGEDR